MGRGHGSVGQNRALTLPGVRGINIIAHQKCGAVSSLEGEETTKFSWIKQPNEATGTRNGKAPWSTTWPVQPERVPEKQMC